jgi:DNA-binding beta-propeller fold protein YncE
MQSRTRSPFRLRPASPHARPRATVAPATLAVLGALGALVALVTLGAGCHDPPDRFGRPTGVAFGPNGDLYVADGYENARIARFDAAGRFVDEWGERGVGRGQFDTPHGIATDDEGRVYVADRENARVQVFDAGGRFLAEWKGPALGRPWAIAYGHDGHLYVVDGGDQTGDSDRGGVVKLDREGHLVERFASGGRGPGQLDWGHGIAVGRDGSVYVADLEGRRVQKFRAP